MNATYQLKNVKTFVGDEGYGLNADITLDGKKICFIRDMADGSEVLLSFTSKGDGPAFFKFCAEWWENSTEKTRWVDAGLTATPYNKAECWVNAKL